MLNKTNAACLLWLLYTHSQFPQVPILISDPFFFPADSHLFLSLACFSASKDRKPLRHKFFQMNISSMFAPGFLLKDRKCWWEECEACCVLAETCKFCFCPEYCKKNTQILKDRHFLCIGAALERVFITFLISLLMFSTLYPISFSLIILYTPFDSPSKDIKEEIKF